MLALRPVARTGATVAAAVALFAGNAANAQQSKRDDEPSKLYAGAGLGSMSFASNHDGVHYGDSGLGLQLYGGWQVRERMAIELGLDRLGGMSSGDVLGSGVQRLRIDADYYAVTLRGMFSLSLEEVLPKRQKITLFATVGAVRSHEQRSVLELNTLQESSATDRDGSMVFGAGVLFDVARVRIRTYFQTDDRARGNVDTLGAAAEFRF